MLLVRAAIEHGGEHLAQAAGLGAQFQGEGHVVVDAHVRIERVGLEHHGDVAVFGRHIVDGAVADVDGAFADVFQAGQHAQAGGLAAARRADEDQEFLVGNLQVQVADGRDIAVSLDHVLKRY